ncbi:diguanylate cyclase [Vibrio cortegadensis]|uniref:sensor domain-containing diguanylate cyclase n=1 Tax=Vibrio cortegadensis TaxID=1328770 RepID=UPI0021C3600B|nr:diguanylate cyclase [Vibrio cortegadensis]MDN3696269.1 diguanylate cyclase [Vibrio cortegadensis]
MKALTFISKAIYQFILIFIALSIVPAIYVVKEYDNIYTKHAHEINKTSFNQLETISNDFSKLIKRLHASTKNMATSTVLLQALQEPNSTNIKVLHDVWALIADGQGYFSKLRFINSDGMEVLRVNYDSSGSFPVDERHLQNQSNREFFQYATGLSANQVGIYSIDLEMENNTFSQPLSPTLRFIVPITVKGDRLGYFVANLNLNIVSTTLHAHHLTNRYTTIINGDGYTLLGGKKSTAYGHLISEREGETLKVTQPELWSLIQSNESGNYFNGKQWTTYSKIYCPFDFSDDSLYMLVTHKNDDFVSAYKNNIEDFKWQVAALLFILVFISISFTVWNITHKKNCLDSKIAKAAMNGMSAVIITDKNNRIITVNQEFTRVSGYTLDEVKGKSPSLFSSGNHNQEFFINMWRHLQTDGQWQGEVINKRKDGTLITEILRIQAITGKNNVIKFYVASFVDITERKELENRLRTLSEKDPLAGCWNRRKFDLELKNECARVVRYPQQAKSCLGIIDIDHFKRVNDKLGHDEGDKVIKVVTEILQKECRETDFIARIGGEEFGVIMPHTTTSEAEIVMNRLRVAVFLHFEEKITISGGVTDIIESSERTYKCADIALYDAKSSGRNKIALFSSSEFDQIA